MLQQMCSAKFKSPDNKSTGIHGLPPPLPFKPNGNEHQHRGALIHPPPNAMFPQMVRSDHSWSHSNSGFMRPPLFPCPPAHFSSAKRFNSTSSPFGPSPSPHYGQGTLPTNGLIQHNKSGLPPSSYPMS